jgi:hypothetical protein
MMLDERATAMLDEIGEVTPGYQHIWKLVRPAPGLTLGDTVLKWYEIAPADAPVPTGIDELARSALRDAAASGELTLSRELGFVILHRCGQSFYFLIVSTWRNENELWETVWAKDAGDAVFHPWPAEGSHRPTYCVWELGAVWHEQQAWSRFLRSRRDVAAKQAYLRDSADGPV